MSSRERFVRLSDTEWIVMRELWQSHPRSVRDVLEAVQEETDWAYTTVKTILERLVGKEIVSVEKRGNTSYFTPQITQQQARRSALKSLLDRAFDGAMDQLVEHLIDDERMSAKERQQLIQKLNELDEQGGGS